MTVRRVLAETYRSALPAVLVSAVGGLLAGLLLSGMDTELAAVDGLLVMIPAFLAIRGSVYGSLGSRLSSALHQGIIAPEVRLDRRLVTAVLAALSNGLLASLAAALFTFLLLGVAGRSVSLLLLVSIALLGGILAGVALTGVIVVAVFGGYRRGMNPDDLVGPVMTTAGDILGMGALFLATRIALALV